MSCDFGVWSTQEVLSDEAAAELYGRLCDGDLSGVVPSPAVDAFYSELTALHPEIDDIPEDRADDLELCPWSVAFDRSPGHILICCVWSRAEYVDGLIRTLAKKHGLVFFDPQDSVVTNPDGVGVTEPEVRPRRPWWRFW